MLNYQIKQVITMRLNLNILLLINILINYLNGLVILW